MLRPGAAQLLFGVSAEELSEQHTRLDDLWGSAAETNLQMLHDAGEPEKQLDLFELLLAGRLPLVHGIHPAVAYALERFDAADRVEAIVKRTGYSHRHFVALFRRTVGLTPKTYSRVLRFRHALRLAAGRAAAPWSRIALDAGYCDQAHFHREFLSFTGLTPAAYRRINPVQPSHVAPPGANIAET
jgi:AraC-like DNA-binding protein